MKRFHISSLIVIGAVTTLLSSNAPAAESSDTSAAPAKDFACGDKGKPPCPMQAWMKANMAPAAANSDGPALAKALEYVAAHAPPGFTEWSKIATAGAALAKKNDVDGAKKTCKTCHDQYKAKYKEDMRDRAF
jgi:hypothetical protein